MARKIAVSGWLFGQRRARLLLNRETRKAKGPPTAALVNFGFRLQSGFDLEAPCFKQRLRNVLGVLIAPSPLPQTGRAQVLIRGKLVLPHDLLKLGNSGDNRPDGLRLTPVRISATLSHINKVLSEINLSGEQLDSPSPAKDSHSTALALKNPRLTENSIAD
jgi:hypothetical protein